MAACLAMVMGMPGLLALILAAACLLWLARPSLAEDKGPAVAQPEVVTTNAIKGISRADIQQKLQKLWATPTPKELKPGATCYMVALPPKRAEYVCPTCGEKTLYTDAATRTVDWDLQTARRTLTGLQKLAEQSISLDESQFCRKCSPDVKVPKLVLRINYEAGQPHTFVGVIPTDLQLLEEFFAGKLVHDTGPHGETPLRNQIPRIQELLGVKSR